MRVWLLDSGSLVIDQSHITWNVGAGTPVRFPVYSVLVEHDDGLFLFDSRLRPRAREGRPALRAAGADARADDPGAARALRLLARRRGDAGHSHLHFDHVGGNRHLPDARVLIHAREIAQARNCEPFERFGYSDRDLGPRAAPAWCPISGDLELAPGLHPVRDARAHRRPLLAARAPRRGARAMLFAFDVVYTVDAYAKACRPGSTSTRWPACARSAGSRALAEEHDADIFFSHDMAAWQGYRHAPDPYEL